MASWFNLTLDTASPGNVALSLNNGSAETQSKNVTAKVTTSDGNTSGYEMKLWGDIQGSGSESSAEWVSYSATKSVTLSSGDGSKTVYAKLRDDVGNKSSVVSASIILNTSEEPVEPGPETTEKEFYSFGGIRDSATFILDDDTCEAVKDSPVELLYKVVTITGNGMVGYGTSGDNPLGVVTHVSYQGDNDRKLVVAVNWNKAFYVDADGLLYNDYAVCDGNGALKKATSYSSAKCYHGTVTTVGGKIAQVYFS